MPDKRPLSVQGACLALFVSYTTRAAKTTEKPSDSDELSKARDQYRAALKRSGLDANEFNKLAREILQAAGITEPTPTDYLKAARRVQLTCGDCSGSGKYYSGGAFVNGRYTGKVGACFRCNGKGFQIDSDRKRNWGYDNFHRRVNI